MKTQWMATGMVLVGAAAGWLTGCVSTPVVPESVRAGLSPDVTFEQVLANPDPYKDKTVLWAGEILTLRSTPTGTHLEILQAPADPGGKPKARALSKGRFLVDFDRHLDGAVYHVGQRVTVVGKVQGSTRQPLGEGKPEYAYPLLAGHEIYMWPRPESLHVYGNRSAPEYWDPWLGPFYQGPETIIYDPQGSFPPNTREPARPSGK